MKKILIVLAIVFFGGVFYSITLRGISGNIKVESIKDNLDQATRPFELSPERGRFLMVMALGDYGTFDLNEKLADAAYPDVGYFQGRYYVFFAPGISMLALPTYLAGKAFGYSQLGAFAIIPVFAVFNLVVLYIISRQIFKLRISFSLIAPLIFGFASSAWSYAITLYQHQVTTFFILSSFYAVWRFGFKTRYSFIWAFWVWICYGLGILIDYPNAFILSPIIIYFFLTAFKFEINKEKIKINLRWAFLFTAVVFVLINIWHGYYNQVNFGSWNKVSGSLIGLKAIREENLFNSESGSEVLKKAEERKNVVRFFHEDNLPFGIYTLLVSADRGIFFYYPIFILAIFGIYYSLKKLSLESGTLIGVVLCDIFLYSSFGDPWGGWAFGARYMIPATACLSLFAVYWLAYTKYKLSSKILAAVLFAYSCAVALLGALTTNAVPPKVEADFLKMNYNFLLNYQFLLSGRSSSFVYNLFFSQYINLITFYLVIYLTVLTVFMGLLIWAYKFRGVNAVTN